MNGEFLKLLQMTEAGRKCDGAECIRVDDVEVERALEVDALEKGHLDGVDHQAHQCQACTDCAGLALKRSELREALHAKGVDFPVEVFQPIEHLPAGGPH